MKLLFLNPIGGIGGAEAVLLDVLHGLRESRPDWSLHLVHAGEGPLAERAAELGVAVRRLDFPGCLARVGDAGAGGSAGHSVSRSGLVARLALSSPLTVWYLARLRGLVRTLRPDILHTNGCKMHLFGVWARLGMRHRPALLWHIHDYIGARPRMAGLLRRHARFGDLAIANSHSVARDLRIVCGDGLPIHAVPNGVSLERFRPQGERLDLDLLARLPPAPAGTIRVGLVASFAKWKGQRTFLRALAQLSPDLPLRAYIIGDGIYDSNGSQHRREELERLAAELGLTGRVGFTGLVSNPAAAFRALDVVVHASTHPEPFGLVIAEAMACGKPVIASSAGGAAELFTDGHDALGHPAGDSKALAERIARLAADPDLRERLGQAARATAEERFCRGRMVGEIAGLHEGAQAVRFAPWS